MGKKDLTARMAKEAGITLHQAQKAFASLLAIVKADLKEGHKVNFSGFGSFEIKVREPRRGRNPKTGESIDIPAKKGIKPSRRCRSTSTGRADGSASTRPTSPNVS
jgi:DNA-binding protein HU-beta